MSGYPVGKQFSRKGNSSGFQQSPVTFQSPPTAHTSVAVPLPTPPGQPLRPPPPQPQRVLNTVGAVQQPPHHLVTQRNVPSPSQSVAPSVSSAPVPPTAAAGQLVKPPLPLPQQHSQRQPQQQPYQSQRPPPAQSAAPPSQTSLPQPATARSSPFLPPVHLPIQPQPHPYSSVSSMSGQPQLSYQPHPQTATPRPQSLIAAADHASLQPPQSAWQRRAASVSHEAAYGSASHGLDAAYGDGSDMAAEEYAQPSSAHRAYTTAAQRRQAPPPAQAQQQHIYRPPPIQPSQQPPAANAPIESARKRSLIDDDDDLLANLPDELFNLQPAAARTAASASANSVGSAAAGRRPVPANMPVQPLPAASGQMGQLTPTKRKADDINVEAAIEPNRVHTYATSPHPRPAVPHVAHQPLTRQPQPDVQFTAHLNALVTSTPARPEVTDMAGVKMEGTDGSVAVKQEAGEYVRLTKKERAQLVLAKTKAEERAAEERAKAAEEKRRAAEEKEKREQAEAALALLRNNLNSLKQETARNAAQSSQQKMAQSQQAEQAKHTMEANYQTIKVERDVLEMQLVERNAQLRRLQQQLQQQQQKGEVAPAPAPQPASSSPPSSQVPVSVKQQPTAMDTADDSAVVATAPSAPLTRATSSASPSSNTVSSTANEALIEAFRNLEPSLLGTDQTEGQRVASQLLTVSVDKDSADASSGSSPLIALLHSLNSYIANQPAAPSHPASQPLAASSLHASFPSVTQHLSHFVKELESSTMQVRDGALPPDALLSPTCHLLNSLCNISSVPVDLSLFAATQSSGLPRRMKAIDDNIVQLLNLMLIVLRSSPTCRKAAVRGLSSSTPVQTAAAVIVPAIYQHPLYAYRPPKSSALQRQLTDRVGDSGSGDTEKSREFNEQRLKERADQHHKQRVDTSPSAASTLLLNYPDPIPLLVNILQSFQRVSLRSQADLFLQPALSCLLLLLDEVIAARVSPSAVGFAGLLDERRLLPLLCWAPGSQQHVSLAVRCVAVQLVGLLVVDRDALRLVAYRAQPTGPSILESLYSCLLSDSERDRTLVDARQMEARSRHHANQRLAVRDDDNGDKWLSLDKRHEVILSTRQHVVRFMAFVVERYGLDGVQWLVNEREREESKESGQEATEMVVLDGDGHHILTLLVRMMTAEMRHIAPFQREHEPLHVLHSSQPSCTALFRDRRPDSIFPLTQPAKPLHSNQQSSKQARSLLHDLRVVLVKETMRLTGRLIGESIPAVAQSARRPPLLPSVVPQLVECSHLLLTLVSDIRASTIRELQSISEEVDQLKTVLLESRVLNGSSDEY